MCWLLPTWHRSSDLVVVANRNLINSLRVRGEWSSGGCEDCWKHVVVRSLAIKAHLAPPYVRSWRTLTFMRVSSCSASCSMPKKRASSSTPAGVRMRIRTHCNLLTDLLRVCLSYPKGWCLRWWWAVRVSDNSGWAQSSPDCGLLDTPPESPACFPKHLKSRGNGCQTTEGTTYWWSVWRPVILIQGKLWINVTFLSEHVSQHTLWFLTNQCASAGTDTHTDYNKTTQSKKLKHNSRLGAFTTEQVENTREMLQWSGFS